LRIRANRTANRGGERQRTDKIAHRGIDSLALVATAKRVCASFRTDFRPLRYTFVARRKYCRDDRESGL
jgi:hypothetical protein